VIAIERMKDSAVAPSGASVTSARVLENLGHQPEDVGPVFHDEHVRAIHLQFLVSRAPGSRSVNTAPRGSPFLSSMSPPCASAIARETASPRPVPDAFVVKSPGRRRVRAGYGSCEAT
jgi:hypothetical protein